ncbi:MAG: RNA methyltransferase [Pricia sp.]
MHESTQISSPHNPLIKKIGVLQDKSRERKKSGYFVLEGLRELQLAIKGKYTLDTVLIQTDLISEDGLSTLLDAAMPRPKIITISKEVYAKLAYRKTTEGLLALARSKAHTLNQLILPSKNPLILIAEAPEKPGNIGALLRTADAANLDAVIVANPKTDLYNPNIIRSSVGCVFTNNIAVGGTTEIISYLKQNGIYSYCATLSASTTYTDVDFKTPSAIVVGTEATGLSQDWLASSAQNIIIPMAGEIDSMNVSVSAAILIFEAKRQRGFS